MELTGYPEETDFGARCQVRVQGLLGRAVYYGGRELLDLEPGDRAAANVKYNSAQVLGGEESAYFTSRGVFLRLYGRGELEAEPGGGLRYLPQRMARGLRMAAGEVYGQPERGLLLAMLTGERDGLDSLSQRRGKGELKAHRGDGKGVPKEDHQGGGGQGGGGVRLPAHQRGQQGQTHHHAGADH